MMITNPTQLTLFGEAPASLQQPASPPPTRPGRKRTALRRECGDCIDIRILTYWLTKTVTTVHPASWAITGPDGKTRYLCSLHSDERQHGLDPVAIARRTVERTIDPAESHPHWTDPTA